MNKNYLNIKEKILGNKVKISNFLENISNNKEGNTWMIEGPEGIGKATLVKLISAALLNIKYQKEDQSNNFFHPDLVIIKKDEQKKKYSCRRYKKFKKVIFQNIL